MKTKRKTRKLATLYFLLITLSIISYSCSTSETNSILIRNSLDIDRSEEVVAIPKTLVDQIVGLDKQNGHPIILDQNNKAIPSQLEDVNGDGNWDQLLMTMDFKPLEEKKVHIRFDNQNPNYVSATDIHFGVGKNEEHATEVSIYKRSGDPRTQNPKKFFQMEGPAWENDKVGFRMYFDPRNGIDIFGKTTSKTVLSSVGLTDDYHTKADWGMDILKVGTSLGAGSIAIKYKDSLYRITGEKATSFKVLEEGPIKASFEMIYPEETIENQKIKVHHKISILKGQPYYHSKVTLSGLSDGMELVSGIVNLKPNTLQIETIKQSFVLSSFGKQSEIGDHLGMSIFFDKALHTDHGTIKKTSDISDSHYVSLKAENDKPIEFYFFVGWENSDITFSSNKGFQNTLRTVIEKHSNPIQVVYE